MNKSIIVGSLVIGGAGVTQAWQAKKPITPVIIGAYTFMLVLSIADMFGGALSTIASALAMVAMTYVVINQFPWQLLLPAAHEGGQGVK